MVNNGERNMADDYYSIHNTGTLTCYICHVNYQPQKTDISTKNPNVYYRACGICRAKKVEYLKNYRAKKEKERNTL